MNIETYHATDPETGMIQTTGNYPTALTPERKQQFLDIYVANGLRFRTTCKQLGISHHTITHHLDIDKEFKKRFNDAQTEYAEELEARQRNYALEPKQFMDRAMQLRALLPEKYAREQNLGSGQAIQINVSGNFVIEAKKRDEMIDAEIVKELKCESDNIMAETLHIHDNNTLTNKTVDNQHTCT